MGFIAKKPTVLFTYFFSGKSVYVTSDDVESILPIFYKFHGNLIINLIVIVKTLSVIPSEFEICFGI